jgi:hypothetical protein
LEKGNDAIAANPVAKKEDDRELLFELGRSLLRMAWTLKSLDWEQRSIA